MSELDNNNDIINSFFDDDYDNNYINNYDEYKDIINYNNESINETRKICKLNNILKKLDGKDPVEVENSYFKEINCISEKEKLIAETNYILLKINEKPSLKEHPYYKLYMNLLRLLKYRLLSNETLTKDYIKVMKQGLITIELDFNLSISFFSEIKEMYDKKLELKKNKRV